MSTKQKVGLLALAAIVAIVSVRAVQDTVTDTSVERQMVNDYNVYALPIPDNVTFAGERAPLEDPELRERFDRELHVNTYWQSNGLFMFKRANRFFPTIERILAEEGVPDDFKYLAVIESGLTDARSPAGASGFWQIMKQTGKEYGLEVNDNVDERYHLEKATRVAAKYLKESYNRFGNWTTAAAAYNAGNAGIGTRLEEQQVDNYYDLLLGQETGRYVFRILAIKQIMENPQQYGFNFRQSDLYSEVTTSRVPVDTAITNIASFAKRYGVNYKILKRHNSWLRENKLNNASRKQYYIEIPARGTYTVF